MSNSQIYKIEQLLRQQQEVVIHQARTLEVIKRVLTVIALILVAFGFLIGWPFLTAIFGAFVFAGMYFSKLFIEFPIPFYAIFIVIMLIAIAIEIRQSPKEKTKHSKEISVEIERVEKIRLSRQQKIEMQMAKYFEKSGSLNSTPSRPA